MHPQTTTTSTTHMHVYAHSKNLSSCSKLRGLDPPHSGARPVPDRATTETTPMKPANTR